MGRLPSDLLRQPFLRAFEEFENQQFHASGGQDPGGIKHLVLFSPSEPRLEEGEAGAISPDAIALIHLAETKERERAANANGRKETVPDTAKPSVKRGNTLCRYLANCRFIDIVANLGGLAPPFRHIESSGNHKDVSFNNIDPVAQF